MDESAEVMSPPVIKTSKNDQIQAKVDEKLTEMEEKNPSSDFSKTNLELISANQSARDDVAKEILLKRTRSQLKKVETESRVDSLTGLLNREGFEEQFDLAIKRLKRNPGRGIFINIDLNGLRETNNTLGHEEGDRLIKEAADSLKRTLRETDIVGRPSGDEFWALLQNSSEDGEKTWFDRINHLMESSNGRVRFSAGACELDINNAEQSRKKADEAMYAAKLNKGDDKNHLMIVQPDQNFVEYIPTPISLDANQPVAA